MVVDISLQMECSATLFGKLFFCAGKLSDVMYVPPWRSIHGGIVMISIIYRNQAYHPS